MASGRLGWARASREFAPAGSRGSADHEALATEVRDNLQPAAEGVDIRGKGPEFAGVDLGAFDGGDALLAYVHAIGDLGLRLQRDLARRNEELLRHAGIVGDAALVGVLTKFEIWSPERLAEVERNTAANFAEAAKQLGL